MVALSQSWGELLDLLAEFLGFSMVSEEGGQAHKRLGLIGWHANLSEQIKAALTILSMGMEQPTSMMNHVLA